MLASAPPPRNVAKLALLRTRVVLRQVNGVPTRLALCDLCGAPRPTDMHEVILTRGDTMKNAALQAEVLLSPYNTQLLCNRCNTQLAEITVFNRWLVGLQLLRYGLDPIVDWLGGLPLVNRDPYLHLVTSVYQDMTAWPYAGRARAHVDALAAHGICATVYTEGELLWQSRLCRAALSSPAT